MREAKCLLALKLFELGRLSSGKAAEMCGMNRVDFILLVGRSGVPVAVAGVSAGGRMFGNLVCRKVTGMPSGDESQPQRRWMAHPRASAQFLARARRL